MMLSGGEVAVKLGRLCGKECRGDAAGVGAQP